jgi:pantoate--beta-alanine ligase
METLVGIRELRERIAQWRRQSQRIAFVPTMGNLHAGHGDLISKAGKLADRVVVSVFVNPLQFGPNEDYAAYPRTPDDDRRLLESLNVDVLFLPSVEEMYPHGQAVTARVQVPGIEDILCGAFRPGHFMGVATVVVKLLNIVQPDVALFGEKDYQQLLIIRRAVRDLCMPVEIIGVPTMREPDGLAMSSRNRYLSPEERAKAPLIHAELERARLAIESGSQDFHSIEQAGMAALQKAGFKPDYFSIRDAATLEAPTGDSKDLVVLTAARIGRARLIDNVKAELRR